MDISSMVAAIAAFVEKVEKLEQRIDELENAGINGSLEARLEEIEGKVMDIEEKMVTDYGLEEKIQETVGLMSFTVTVD